MTKHNNTNAFASTDGEEEFSVEEWANRMVIYAKGAEIRTMDQLLDAANVDTSVWEVCGKPYLNKWSVGAKAKSASLEYDDGRMTGTIDEHGLVIAPLFQVKLTLVRKKPIIVEPAIQPIEFSGQYSYPVSSGVTERHKVTRSLIFADNQIGYTKDIGSGKLTPFHERRCLDLALQVGKAAGIDEVIVAGDWLDLSEWSDKFVQSPAFFQTTQPSLEEAFFWLKTIRETFPHARITVKLGNHEQRMRRMIATHLPFAYDLTPVSEGIEIEVPPALSLPNLLQLDRLGITFDTTPSNEVHWLNDSLGVMHGDIIKHQPGATARTYVEKYRKSIVFFHTHRAESVSMPTIEWGEYRQIATALNPGCMCHVDGRVPGSRKDNTWTQGFAIVDYDDENASTITQVPVVDGLAVFAGMAFFSRQENDIIDSLSSQFGRWQW